MCMKTNVKMKALKCAFPHTIPIMTGFLFLGMSYGIYMHVSGFSFWYPMLMAMTIFAGSVEFVCVNFLLGAFNPLQAFTEVPEWSAIKPAGIGMDAAGCPIKPGYAC